MLVCFGSGQNIEDGTLNISLSGEKIKGLVRIHGTPLQIADLQVSKDNLAKAAGILRPYGWESNIFYSYKTNPVPEVLNVLHQNGAGAEVISERELNLALSLGVNPDRIVFNGIYKSPAALKTAVEKKIRCINIDAPQELDLLEELSRTAPGPVRVGLRVRPSVGWQGQFGHIIKDGSAYAMAEKVLANKKLDLIAIHFHLGSSNLPVYRRAIVESLAFIGTINRKLGTDIQALDIGGGFPGKDMRMLNLWEQGWLRLWDRSWPAPVAGPDDGFRVLEEAAGYFKQAKEKCGLGNLEMWAEPGRLITGDAQVLAVRVVGLRTTGRKQYAIVDGGRVGAAGPLVGETRKVSVLGKNQNSNPKTYDIVGPTCMPWDRLFAGARLPELEMGDILVIDGAGAYFVPMETEFSFAKPKMMIS
jgi:diaminopimelate decarboxylase